MVKETRSIMLILSEAVPNFMTNFLIPNIVKFWLASEWIMLHFHLYSPAKNLCKNIQLADIKSKDDIDSICKALHKRDSLSGVSNECTTSLPFRILSGAIM